MIKKIDTEEGRREYSKRIGAIEPVFANITHTLGLKRFSLRGKAKVTAQWLAFCLVHNIGKDPEIQDYRVEKPTIVRDPNPFLRLIENIELSSIQSTEIKTFVGPDKSVRKKILTV